MAQQPAYQTQSGLLLLLSAAMFLQLTALVYFGRSTPEQQAESDLSLLDSQKQEPWIYFVHVGKTGGMSLLTGLPITKKKDAFPCLMKSEVSASELDQRMQHCYRDQLDRVDPALARHTLTYLHLDSAFYSDPVKEWVMNHSNTFLFTVRNPVARVVSVYNYHRHENFAHRTNHDTYASYYRFYNCFSDDANAMAEALASKYSFASADIQQRYPTTTERNKCICLAKRILQGEGPSFKLHHFDHGYQFYVQQTLDRKPQNTVLVARTEHLWNDTAAIDMSLGGTGNLTYSKYTHGSENYKVQSKVTSRQGQRAICCEIVNDLVAHQRIIAMAVNLSPQEKQDTLQQVLHDCGIEERTSIYFSQGAFLWDQWHHDTCTRRMTTT